MSEANSETPTTTSEPTEAEQFEQASDDYFSSLETTDEDTSVSPTSPSDESSDETDGETSTDDENPAEGDTEPKEVKEKSTKVFVENKKLKEQLEEHKRELENIKKQSSELEDWKEQQKALFKKNKMEFLKEWGVTVQDFASELLDSDEKEPDPTAELRAKIEQLERERESEKKAAQDEKNKAFVLKHYDDTINEVKNGGDKYPYINATGLYDNVWKHRIQTFKQSGKRISTAEAAKEVEEGLKDFYQKLEGVARPMVVEQVKPQVNQPPMTTVSSDVQGSSSGEVQQLSEEEMLNKRMEDYFKSLSG